MKDANYKLDKTFVYTAGQPTEVTGRDGVTTAYIWGNNNNFPIVKAIGISYAALSAAYTTVNGNLSTLRAQIPSALVYTYTFDPLIGMTSQTDPNGVVTTYAYDAYGRLVHVMDQNGKVLKQYKYNATSKMH